MCGDFTVTQMIPPSMSSKFDVAGAARPVWARRPMTMRSMETEAPRRCARPVRRGGMLGSAGWRSLKRFMDVSSCMHATAHTRDDSTSFCHLLSSRLIEFLACYAASGCGWFSSTNVRSCLCAALYRSRSAMVSVTPFFRRQSPADMISRAS
jgi:hypothetical protein